MSEQLFIIGVIICVIIAVIGLDIRERIKLRNKIRQQWGRLPYHAIGDKEASLKQAYQVAKSYRQKKSEVDDITWYDLDLFEVFEQINHTYSSIGSEALYQRLRTFDFAEKDQQELEKLIAFFKENPKIREDMEYTFARLGKKDKNFVAQYLADGQAEKFPHLWPFVLLGSLPFLGIALFFLGWSGGIFISLGAVCFNTIYYMRKKELLNRELTSMSYLVQSISCGKQVSKLNLPLQAELKQLMQPLQGILKFAFSFRIKSNSEAELLFEYLNIMLMLPFISYQLVLSRIGKYNQEAVSLWELLGKLEIAAAILNYRAIIPLSCQPRFMDGGIQAVNLYHPLVEQAVANPVDWQRNTLVTGSNASGKSTYVKAIGINCILAQTIYTVLAEEFSLQYGHVLTSMAVEDDIFQGDSYFVAEIKSIKRVLEKVQTNDRCYCFIDEILKGTNTIERIAASSSIINWLNVYPSLAFVATHDIELTEILKHTCENVSFEEKVTQGQGIEFDYRLKKGPATSRNAIQLLQVLEYPATIIEKAKQEAASFEKARQWPVY